MTTPRARQLRISTSTLAGRVKINMMMPTSRPVETPDETPEDRTVRQLRRPSTRSTDLRSVPTIARFWTANFSSAR